MAQRTPVTIDDEIEQDRNGRIEQPGRDSKPPGDVPKVAGFDLYAPSEFVDGGTDTPGSDSPGSGKRRGRPRGSRNAAKTETKTPHNLAEGLEKLLLSVHAMGSVFLHCPELELDPMEAKILASSVRDLSKYYPISLDPKRLAMIEFSTVLASVYGLRGVAIYRRLKNESKKPKLVPQPIREQPKTASGSGAPAASQAAPTETPKTTRLPVPSDVWGADNGVEDLSQL